MPVQNQEIITVIIIGSILALLLVLFIVSILFLYQRRQHTYEKDLVKLKEQYEQELLRSQMEIQEKTMKELGEEIHDNIGQMLSVVKLSMATVRLEQEHPAKETVQSAKEILNTAIIDLSNLTKRLHTDRILQIGLEHAIEFEVNTIRKTGLVDIDFDNPVGEHQGSLDSKTSIFLFRMFQEILNNTLKHSKATHVKVGIFFTGTPNFILKIEDNGIGFNVKEKQNSTSQSGGVGLKSMMNRARLIGANFKITSKEGAGTSVVITLPLKKDTETRNPWL